MSERRLLLVLVVLVSLGVPSDANAAGGVPMTPFFGGQYMIGMALGSVLETAWLCRRFRGHGWPLAVAGLVVNGVLSLLLMVVYVSIWSAVSGPGKPLAGHEGVWIVNSWDLLVFPVFLVASIAAESVLLSPFGRSDRQAFWKVMLWGNVGTYALVTMLFAFMALTNGRA